MDWRIFFIGPMPSDGNERFNRMVEAVVAELRENGYQPPEPGEFRLTEGKLISSLALTRPEGQDRITLLRPHDLFGPGSVAANVFDAIDDADLVIADLSDARPAVVYELAFAHALGIYTILLGPESDTDANSDLMFYLKPYRHIPVEFSKRDIRSDEFKHSFRTWLEGRNKRFDSRNPFTDFYDAPIPDISAASGLANGYFENFLRRVLAPDSELVIMSEESGPSRQGVAGVIVVRPENCLLYTSPSPRDRS